MPARRKSARKSSLSNSGLQDWAATFFGSLAEDADGRRLLSEQNHRIEFDLTDQQDAFSVEIKSGRIRTRKGVIGPRRY